MASKHSQAPTLISQGVFDSVKNFREFEQKVSALVATNTKAQGDAFEIFVEAYLATQPILQCQETWLVGDIPVEIREALNLPNDSKGIDGIYKSMLDVYVPYQVKFRSNRPALGFNEVAPFLGITEKATDRLLITNCDSIAIDVQNRTGIRSLRGVDFDQLSEEDFTVIENWLKKKPKKRKPLTPDPYQVDALTNIARHLEVNDRGTVVMACGTGKTLVALWAVEQSKAKSILVLVPSLTLLQQTLEEWSVHNAWGKDFSYLCVCSDPSVDLKNDEIEIDPSDLPFRIDTDPEVVKGYLAQDNGKTKIVFSTYQSSQVVSQATKGEFEFDIAVFDEAHKTTGSATGRFAFGLKDENIKIKKRLFLTATPKHYDISKRDKDGEFKFVSMDDEAVYGKRAHTLTFGDAAKKGIICPYKVVVTLIDKHQVDDFALKNGITLVEGDSVKAKWVASQIAVSSAIKHTGATKIITFHSRVKAAREFSSDEVYGVKKFVKDFEVFHVHGKQKSNERKDTISKFKKASRSIITNAKCLTEGVDVPAVDMVAFVDPRHSKIDIAQAVGRAMRKPRGGDKKVGYIVVPIFAEDTSEQSLEKAIKSEDFDDVALILNSLLEQDEELVEIVQELKQAKGRGEVFNPQRLKEKIEVIGPLIGLDELTNSIYIEAIDRLGESWDEWYGRLVKFKKREGHCQVTRNHIENSFKLGLWVKNQRKRRLILTNDRILRLKEIDFIWDPYTEQWEAGFAALVKFKEREGNCLVSRNYLENNFRLGQWVGGQRNNKSELPEDRLDRLNEIGFVWDPYTAQWEAGYTALVKFKEREGNCLVQTDHLESDYRLGQWVDSQRQNKSELPKDRLDRLNEIGFIWDSRTYKWEAGFAALVKFKEREGNCLVHGDHIESDYRLGEWVSNQRSIKDKLPKDRLQDLDKLGFVWNVTTDQWEEGFNALVTFKEREGNCLVPNNHLENGYRLGQWVSVQRRSKNISDKSNPQIRRLIELGFVWNKFKEQWGQGFKFLENYKNREGHCLVPYNHIEDDFRLGQWVTVQRSRKEKITAARIQELEGIGFIWDSQADQWEAGYTALVKFKEREGNCQVHGDHIESDYRLGQWVGKQRSIKSKLPEDLLNRLNEIGFIWDSRAEQWETGYSALVKFKEREGHCLVPSKHNESDYRLGQWVDIQRQNKSELPKDRLDRLNEIGFIWNSRSDQWEIGFSALIIYKKSEGHCLVPQGYIEDGFRLGEWVSRQRQRKTKASEDRIRRLDEIGFIWAASKS